MQYKFEHKNYSNFNVRGVNKLPPHAYFIPFNTLKTLESTDYLNERYKSDMVELLNGEWGFKYYDKVSKLPSQFDTSAVDFDNIVVPSCWQFNGYEEPFYLNSRYQFKPNPPTIPTDIPIGVYRRTLSLANIAEKEIITFLGACSNLELYVNGAFVGYSEGSHNPAEFDLTSYLKIGENEIICLVYKFCNGSYLEAQDMFRNNGIFRDVYLTHSPKERITDFYINPIKKGEDYAVSFSVKAEGENVNISLSVYDGNSLISQVAMSPNETKDIIIENAKEWNAEEPNLYTAIIQLTKDGKTVECIRKEFGCKSIEIIGNVFTLNGRKIKLKGVNHHDTNESKGYCMSVEDYLKDVRLMKEFNVNAVRTSHYPADPLMMSICDHYGIYVVDEADIECHGVSVQNYYHPNIISDNLAWKEHYWERVAAMYERDKNSPSIVMWSLGNESGGYKCHDYCYDMLKAVGAKEPIHYEGAIRTKRFAYDVISRMYFGTNDLEKYLKNLLPKKNYEKPFFQCEYAHAMGVGPGELDYYWDLYYSCDAFMGGCIWEWCDHAIKHENDKYPYKYTYGGDHGEFIHDGNFCVDGLFYPDRTPHTGAYCMKNVYRPVRAKYIGGNKIVLSNTNAFKDSSYIEITWELKRDGITVEQGVFDKTIEPLTSKEFDITNKQYDGDIHLIIVYKDKQSGLDVAEESLTIRAEINSEKKSNYAKLIDSPQRVGFEFDKGAILFSKTTGEMESYNYDKQEYACQAPQREDKLSGLIPTIYRAPVDNYRNIDRRWRRQGLDKSRIRFDKYEVSGGKLILYYDVLIRNKRALAYVSEYTAYSDGTIDVSVRVKNNLLFVKYDLPKIGLTMELDGSYRTINYYGLGDKENYSDFNKQSVMGIYSHDIHDTLQPYIKPQDSGNRSEVRWAELTDEKGEGLRIEAIEVPLNVTATDVTLDTLLKANHREDLRFSKSVVLCVDGFVRGIGSNSCGPDTRSKFKYMLGRKNPFNYAFRIKPMIKN